VRLGEAISHRGYIPRDEVERYAQEYQSLSTVYV
jgi:hypothetical protein